MVLNISRYYLDIISKLSQYISLEFYLNIEKIEKIFLNIKYVGYREY